MTNQTIAAAVDAVKAASELATELATVEPNATTESCGIPEDNSAFTEAVSSAEAAIQLAMDDVCGQTLTTLDFALDELRLARKDYFLPVLRNASTPPSMRRTRCAAWSPDPSPMHWPATKAISSAVPTLSPAAACGS